MPASSITGTPSVSRFAEAIGSYPEMLDANAFQWRSERLVK